MGVNIGRNAFHYAETIVFPQWAEEFGGSGFLPSGTCAGDFNNNGSCGSDDLLLLLTVYGQNWAGPYDMNNSNVVEVNDLLLFLQRFGVTCD